MRLQVALYNQPGIKQTLQKLDKHYLLNQGTIFVRLALDD